MFQHVNPHLILDLHAARVHDLRNEADDYRLGRSTKRRAGHPKRSRGTPAVQ